MPAQVRLDADVEAALRLAVERDGGSLSQSVNRALRMTLGIGGQAKSGAAKAKVTATVGQAGGRCLHPVNRRIGAHCAACGDRVGGK